jgi:hypothetical protein
MGNNKTKDSMKKSKSTSPSTLTDLNACDEAIKWVREGGFKSLEKAWLACERGDWMLWFAQRRGADIKTLTLAKCGCARLALPHTKDPRVLACIETAERWARGEATEKEMEDARRSAYAASAKRIATLKQCAVIVRGYFHTLP